MPTLTELKQTAKDMKLKGYSTLKKADLIILIDTAKNKPEKIPRIIPSSSLTEDHIRVMSIDIGKKNFAFCIEEFNPSVYDKLSCTKTSRYTPEGTISDEFQPTVDSICNHGKIILYINTDLTTNCKTSKKYLDPEIYYNMTDLLDKYKDYIDNCSCIIIEQQLSFGFNKTNTMAMKLGQHCYSYFVCRYGREKTVCEFPAYHKTQVLGAQKIKHTKKNGKTAYKVIDKPARKKWSVKTAQRILEQRNELDILDELNTASKKDDLADVFTQLQAYKCLTYIKE